MPILTGSLADVVGELLVAGQVRQAFVKAPAARGSLASGDRLIVSAPVPVAASGTISLDLEPGPAVLVVDTYAGGPDVYDLYVTSDMTLLSDALAESAQDRSWSESVMVQLRKEAVEAAEQAALDREQTGLDRVATSEDRTQTGLDRTQTGLDRVATGQDRTATGEDRTQTGLDREQARLDRVATGQDRTQTGLDRVAAAGSASAAETAANEFGLTVTSSQVGPEVPSSATLSGDGPAYAIHLGLSKGRPGDKGDPGEVTTAALNSALAGKADLTGGQVPTSQLPAIALTKPFPVADRAGMLALSAQEGDVAVITGGADKGTYMLSSGPSGTFGSWVKLTVPDAPVQSVNGQTGTVNIGASDVGASPTGHKHAVPADLTATGTASSETYLRGDGSWQTPQDTTYAVPTQAEAEAGTANAPRAFSARRVRQAIDARAVTRQGSAQGLWVGTASSLPDTGTSGVLYVTTE